MIIMKLGASFFPVWLRWHRAEWERSLVVLLNPIMGLKKKACLCIRHTFLISHCFLSLGRIFCHLKVVKLQTTLHMFSKSAVIASLSPTSGLHRTVGSRGEARHVGGVHVGKVIRNLNL